MTLTGSRDPGVQAKKTVVSLKSFKIANHLQTSKEQKSSLWDPGIQGSKPKRQLFVCEPLEITNLALWDPGI